MKILDKIYELVCEMSFTLYEIRIRYTIWGAFLTKWVILLISKSVRMYLTYVQNAALGIFMERASNMERAGKP